MEAGDNMSPKKSWRTWRWIVSGVCGQVVEEDFNVSGLPLNSFKKQFVFQLSVSLSQEDANHSIWLMWVYLSKSKCILLVYSSYFFASKDNMYLGFPDLNLLQMRWKQCLVQPRTPWTSPKSTLAPICSGPNSTRTLEKQSRTYYVVLKQTRKLNTATHTIKKHLKAKVLLQR